MKVQYLLVGLSLMGLLSVGCGNSLSDSNGNFASSAVNPGVSPLDPNSNHGFIVGRAVLDTYLPDAKVEFVTTGGQVFYTLTTDKRGWFTTRGLLPADFTIRVYRGSDVFRSEVRGTGGLRGTLYVNAGTTLASAYLQAHPELSLQQAEEKVRAYLKLPAGFRMAWVSTVRNHAFSTPKFFQAIQTAGSLDAFLTQQVALIDAAPAFLETALGDTLKFVGQTAASTLLGSTINDTVGDALANCGFNFTTPGALSQIEDTLDDIETSLASLTNALSSAAALAKVAFNLSSLDQASLSIQTEVGSIQTGIASFASSHSNAASLNVPETPGDPNTPNSLSSSQAILLSFNLSQTIAPITSNLLTPNVTQAMADAVAAQAGWQFTDKSNFDHYPWRSNTSTDQIRSLMAKYIGTLYQASDLYFEQAHITSGTSYAAQLTSAASTAGNLTGICQQAAQYVPDNYAADNVLVDMATGSMYLNEFVAAKNLSDANDYVYNLEVGPYGAPKQGASQPSTRWHFPHSNHLTSLCQNRLVPMISSLHLSNGTWGDTSTSDWKTAFTSLGFDVSSYVPYNNPGNPHESTHEGTFMLNDTSSNDNLFIWNNEGTNPALDEDDGDSSHTISFLCEIDYNAVNSGLYVADQNGQNTDPALRYQLNPDNIVSPFSDNSSENNAIFHSVASSSSSGTQMAAVMDVPGGAFDITNRVYWTSSNSAVASISNYAPTGTQVVNNSYTFLFPGPAGFITWHPPIFPGDPPLAPVTITSQFHMLRSTEQSNHTLLGDGTSFTATYQSTVSPPAGLAAHLKALAIRPFNVKYNLTGLASGAAQTVEFSLTAFFDDGRVIDVSKDPNTVWRLFNDQGVLMNSSAAGGGFGINSNPDINQCFLYNTVRGQTLTVSADYTSPVGALHKAINIGTVTSVL